MNDNVLNINVTLAGRNYPVLASSEEEALAIRQINSQLNSEFLSLQNQYASKLNKQDILAMLLLTYAQRLHETRNMHNMDAIETRINDIAAILEDSTEVSL